MTLLPSMQSLPGKRCLILILGLFKVHFLSWDQWWNHPQPTLIFNLSRLISMPFQVLTFEESSKDVQEAEEEIPVAAAEEEMLEAEEEEEKKDNKEEKPREEDKTGGNGGDAEELQ